MPRNPILSAAAWSKTQTKLLTRPAGQEEQARTPAQEDAICENLERDGHVPRLKVIQRSVESGADINTSLDSEKLPAAHGACVAKNGGRDVILWNTVEWNVSAQSDHVICFGAHCMTPETFC